MPCLVCVGTMAAPGTHGTFLGLRSCPAAAAAGVLVVVGVAVAGVAAISADLVPPARREDVLVPPARRKDVLVRPVRVRRRLRYVAGRALAFGVPRLAGGPPTPPSPPRVPPPSWYLPHACSDALVRPARPERRLGTCSPRSGTVLVRRSPSEARPAGTYGTSEGASVQGRVRWGEHLVRTLSMRSRPYCDLYVLHTACATLTGGPAERTGGGVWTPRSLWRARTWYVPCRPDCTDAPWLRRALTVRPGDGGSGCLVRTFESLARELLRSHRRPVRRALTGKFTYLF